MTLASVKPGDIVRVAGAPLLAAVGRIAQQFSAGGSARTFPRLEGWCCTTRGPAG